MNSGIFQVQDPNPAYNNIMNMSFKFQNFSLKPKKICARETKINIRNVHETNRFKTDLNIAMSISIKGPKNSVDLRSIKNLKYVSTNMKDSLKSNLSVNF